MKKIMLLAAILAMVLAATVPAIAQVTQSNEQDVESGDADQSFTVTGSGDNSNQCAPIQGVGQSGNAVNNTDVLQTNGDDNDVEVDDSSNLAVSPEQAAKCEQKVNQAASASAAPAPAPAPAPKAAAKAEAKTEKAEAKKAAAPKQLPATGGVSLFALGAGVLLVGGGLLARRIFR